MKAAPIRASAVLAKKALPKASAAMIPATPSAYLTDGTAFIAAPMSLLGLKLFAICTQSNGPQDIRHVSATCLLMDAGWSPPPSGCKGLRKSRRLVNCYASRSKHLNGQGARAIHLDVSHNIPRLPASSISALRLPPWTAGKELLSDWPLSRAPCKPPGATARNHKQATTAETR